MALKSAALEKILKNKNEFGNTFNNAEEAGFLTKRDRREDPSSEISLGPSMTISGYIFVSSSIKGLCNNYLEGGGGWETRGGA